MQGFLVPRTRQNSLLGFGLEFPYFVPIGTDKDVTLIPYVSTETKTLKAKYRQALNNGRLTVNTAVSKIQFNQKNSGAACSQMGHLNCPMIMTWIIISNLSQMMPI